MDFLIGEPFTAKIAKGVEKYEMGRFLYTPSGLCGDLL